jgi:hypothetical protein
VYLLVLHEHALNLVQVFQCIDSKDLVEKIVVDVGEVL